jgi:hypothetical protein
MSWTIRITHTDVAKVGVGRRKLTTTGRPAGSKAVRIYLDQNSTTSSSSSAVGDHVHGDLERVLKVWLASPE